MRRLGTLALGAIMAVGWTTPGSGQGRPDPAVTLAAQRNAMSALAAMDGVWRGTAWVALPSGEKGTLTQTERVGPMLNGSIKVVEGRGYGADGALEFQAFATISYDPGTKAYTMHSSAQGSVGDFHLTPTANGYVWEIPAGPVTIRYTAVIQDGHWQEVGDRLVPGKEPVRIFESNLDRVGDTDWPAAGALGP